MFPRWLKRFATNWKVAGSGSDKVTEFFQFTYKPEGRGFDTRGGKFLNLPNHSGVTRPWGLLSL
jgi:hypothetical protein